LTKTGIFLLQYLEVLAPFLGRQDVTDIYINTPQELWVETLDGTTQSYKLPTLTNDMLDNMAAQIAAYSNQGINREHPLLAGILPDGARVQIILPPATRGPIAIAIRKHVMADMDLSDFAVSDVLAKQNKGTTDIQTRLATLLSTGDIGLLLQTAVQARCNILISGGTSTGKTTFLNALIKQIASDERLIYIEDTAELLLKHTNAIGLLAPRNALGEASVAMEDLLTASLRMRPDRILLGELRGAEAFTFLRAVNTGHPGSMSTIHADTPDRALEQLVMLVLQAGTKLSRENIIHYVRASIDVYVQIERVGGKRQIADIRLREPI
jgi:type IV secretion system protein VirB11